ncbi:MAG: disulfide oxidoreductase [archaeon]
MLVQEIINILAILTVIGDLFIGLSLIILFSGKRLLKEHQKNIKKHYLAFAIIVAIIGTLGSLFFSEIAHFEPCKLCWFQRIFYYPLTIVFGIGLFYKDKNTYRYAVALSAIGAVFAAYHYIIQRLSIQTTCSVGAVSCTTIEMFKFGYVTFPMMALTGFVMMLLFLTLYRK